MADNEYLGVGNIPASYVESMKKRSKELMGGKDFITQDEVESIFAENGMKYSPYKYGFYMDADGKTVTPDGKIVNGGCMGQTQSVMSQDEFAAFLAAADGMYDPQKKDFVFDGQIKAPKKEDIKNTVFCCDADEGKTQDALLDKFGVKRATDYDSNFPFTGNR